MWVELSQKKKKKTPFCCTFSILQLYFTHLWYINFWVLEHHFIEKKIMTFFIFFKSILWHPVIHSRVHFSICFTLRYRVHFSICFTLHSRVHFSICFTLRYRVHFSIKILPQTKKIEKCKPWEHPRYLYKEKLIAVLYTLRTFWNQFFLGGICKQE